MRLALDVDGVLADFHCAFRTAAHQVLGRRAQAGAGSDEFGTRLSPRDQRRTWRHILHTPDWWTRLPPYEPRQLHRLYTLSRDRRWEVFFITRRPPTAGDPVQLQTQRWLEEHGFYFPSVITVPGSRGELANALRLDLVIDDHLVHCVEVISSSRSKALLLLRHPPQQEGPHQTIREIDVVHSLEQAIDVAEQLAANTRGRFTAGVQAV